MKTTKALMMTLALSSFWCLQEATSTEVASDQLPEQIVQTQLEAYNSGDIDAFVATYASDIKLYRHPDTEIGSGTDNLRETYSKLFKDNPDLNAKILKRITQGNFVIDHEWVTGLANGGEIYAVAIYEVKAGKIQNVWFLR